MSERTPRPIPALNNAKELAEVLVTSIVITTSMIPVLPKVQQETALNAVVDTTEKYIQTYTDRHFKRID